MSDFPPLVDLHNHLIPGVDDGARDLEEALAALAKMHEHGVRRLVATPHLNADLIRRGESFRERVEQIDAAWRTFRTAATARCPEIQIARGHEIMLDVPEPELVEPCLRLAGGPWVLVEFPRLFIPAGSTHALHHLRRDGWRPLVAHPERYVNVNADSGDLSIVNEWRRAGAHMIINAGSLMGGFGSGALVTVREMLRRGWVDMIGSDYHARPGRPLLLREGYERLFEWGGEEQAQLLFSINPGRVMDGQDALPVPTLPLGDGLWGRIRNMFSR